MASTNAILVTGLSSDAASTPSTISNNSKLKGKEKEFFASLAGTLVDTATIFETKPGFEKINLYSLFNSKARINFPPFTAVTVSTFLSPLTTLISATSIAFLSFNMRPDNSNCPAVWANILEINIHSMNV